MRRDQGLFLLASTVAMVVWFVPALHYLALPLIYLNTHLHELCHAAAAVATGGDVGTIRVNADGSGLTNISGGWMVIVASAGYIGSTIIGGFLVWWAKDEKTARQSLGLLAAIMAFSMLVWVRGDTVGVVSGIAWIAVLGLGARFLRGHWAPLAVWFLGAIQCLASLDAFRALFSVAIAGGHNDAGIMQQATGLPAVLWLVFSGGVLAWTLRSSWNRGGSGGAERIRTAE